jgi:hypothetical protein
MNQNQTHFSRSPKNQTAAGLGDPSRGFSLLPLLLDSQSISFAARRALRENRVNDAVVILMQDYGLSCVEAGDLLNVAAC